MANKITTTKDGDIVLNVFVDGAMVGKIAHSLGKTNPGAPYSNGFGVDRYVMLEVNGKNVYPDGPMYATINSAAQAVVEASKQ